MKDVFERRCSSIGRLQQGGLLGLYTLAVPPSVLFTYYWTDLGNLVLAHFKLIDNAEREKRYETMPKHLRRIS